MMSTFLLCWYAMAWVAKGLDFATEEKDYNRIPLMMCLFLGPIGIIAVLFAYIIENIPKNNQYLWKKP